MSEEENESLSSSCESNSEPEVNSNSSDNEQSSKRKKINVNTDSDSDRAEEGHRNKKIRLAVDTVKTHEESSRDSDQSVHRSNEELLKKYKMKDAIIKLDQYEENVVKIRTKNDSESDVGIEHSKRTSTSSSSDSENVTCKIKTDSESADSGNSSRSSKKSDSSNPKPVPNDSESKIKSDSDSSTKKKKLTKTKKASTQTQSGSDSESDNETNDKNSNKTTVLPESDPKIIKMKQYVRLAGLRIQNYTNFWEGCKNNRARAQKILEFLHEKGLQGQPSKQKCEQLRIKLETAKEISELNTNNIINSEGRSRRCRFNNSAEAEAQSPVPVSNKQIFSRIRAIVDSDSD